MPTYDYKCLACKEIFEVFQKMNDALLKKCPKCNGNVRRLISSGSGLIFKGKGFYATDYRKTNAGIDRSKTESSPCTGCKDTACKESKNKEK